MCASVAKAEPTDDNIVYAVECWEALSAFANPACNCLGRPAHPKLGSRPTLTVVVGSWCVSAP